MSMRIGGFQRETAEFRGEAQNSAGEAQNSAGIECSGAFATGCQGLNFYGSYQPVVKPRVAPSVARRPRGKA